MSLSYALTTPHPPVMVSSVGGEEGLRPIKKTVEAMKKISEVVAAKKPEVLIFITPHGPVFPDAINIRIPPEGRLEGDLMMFGSLERWMFKSDNELGREIRRGAEKEGLKIIEIEEDVLDHGVLAPLSYLAEVLPKTVELVSMNISMASYRVHFNFGKVVQKVCSKYPKRIVFVASGDLSHSLKPGAPAPYNPAGKKFDEKLVKLLEEGKTEQVLLLDPFWVDEAAECGLRSICTLLGAVEGLNYEQKNYSYEGPYGVGYLVMGYNLKNNLS